MPESLFYKHQKQGIFSFFFSFFWMCLLRMAWWLPATKSTEYNMSDFKLTHRDFLMKGGIFFSSKNMLVLKVYIYIIGAGYEQNFLIKMKSLLWVQNAHIFHEIRKREREREKGQRKAHSIRTIYYIGMEHRQNEAHTFTHQMCMGEEEGSSQEIAERASILCKHQRKGTGKHCFNATIPKFTTL